MSGATGISLSVWLYHETGSAVVLATVVAVKSGLSIYASPYTGRIADRIARKKLIIVADVALAACSAVLVWLTSQGSLAIAAVVGVVAVTGLLDSLLLVSLAASVRDVRSETNLTRVNGIVSLLDASPTIVAPLLGTSLYQTLGLTTVLMIDGATFLCAALLTAVASWDAAHKAARKRGGRVPFEGATAGLRLILRDKELSRLQFSFAGINTLTGLGATALTAYVLSSPNGGAAVLGTYNSVGAAGLLTGAGIVMAIGARLPRAQSISGGLFVAGLGGRVLFGLVASTPVWYLSSAVRSIGIQLSNAPLTALWQEQTSPADQGKVFGARRLLGQGTYPLAVVVGGLIADACRAWQPDHGIAAFLVILGTGECALAMYLHLSGVLRSVVNRHGVFIASTP